MTYEELLQVDTSGADLALEKYKLVTKEGVRLTPENTPKGQKVIMETILTRRSPFYPYISRRAHIECITRYGKSMIIGASVAIVAHRDKSPWAVIAPTGDKSKIIMEYAIQFATSDPIMRASLVIDTKKDVSKVDKLKEHQAKDHITFKGGGEVRAFSAGQGANGKSTGGDTLMGFGSPNVIEDECYLIDDQTHSKVMRMLGDNPHDNFLMKIGNPFNRGHGLQSRQDPNYARIILDHTIALKEGRITESFLDEMRDKPNFSVLYECLPPEADAQDSKGYLPLFTERLIKDCQVDETAIAPFGRRRDGVDVSDGGDNFSVIVSRWENVAKVRFRIKGKKSVAFAGDVILQSEQAHAINWDGTGVGAGGGQLLATHPIIGERFQSIKVGDPSTEPDKYFNLRAELYWKLKVWLESGGRLEKHPNWEQLKVIKYKVNHKGQIQIISKDELRKNNIASPDEADALSLTFAPDAPEVSNVQGGGIAGESQGYW